MIIKKPDGRKVYLKCTSGVSTVRVMNPQPMEERPAYQFFKKVFEDAKRKK